MTPRPIHLFRRWLSYIFEQPVGEFTSQYNQRLSIFLHKGRYKLVTHGAIYSFEDLYSNYSRSFDQLDWNNHPVKSCLILGLGLGSIPVQLEKRFPKKIAFTAVEIDEIVTKLALEYVLRPKGIHVQVFTADASSFLEWHAGKYDMICSDVFVGDKIPKDLETEEALLSMKRLLKPKGLLLYNRLSRFRPDIDISLKFRDEVFLKVFPDGGYLDVDGNWMFVNNIAAFSANR
ncbi:MAG: methyltransferase domain-containing protein [Bacteroidota bacterium]|nr:methyltransferase domain-containing protein [Bacteroidota bacterium]